MTDWQMWRIRQLRLIIKGCEKIMRLDNYSAEFKDYAKTTWTQSLRELQRLQLATFNHGKI